MAPLLRLSAPDSYSERNRASAIPAVKYLRLYQSKVAARSIPSASRSTGLPVWATVLCRNAAVRGLRCTGSEQALLVKRTGEPAPADQFAVRVPHGHSIRFNLMRGFRATFQTQSHILVKKQKAIRVMDHAPVELFHERGLRISEQETSLPPMPAPVQCRAG